MRNRVAREPLEKKGGTTFHFVTEGIESAVAQATDAAHGQDIWLAGGASVINQYLAAGLVDEIDISIAPVIMAGGERLFEELQRGALKLTSGNWYSSLTNQLRGNRAPPRLSDVEAAARSANAAGTSPRTDISPALASQSPRLCDAASRRVAGGVVLEGPSAARRLARRASRRTVRRSPAGCASDSNSKCSAKRPADGDLAASA
jgi:RibD C-terminal domain